MLIGCKWLPYPSGDTSAQWNNVINQSNHATVFNQCFTSFSSWFITHSDPAKCLTSLESLPAWRSRAEDEDNICFFPPVGSFLPSIPPPYSSSPGTVNSMSLELDQRSDLPIPQRSYSISQKESYRYQGDEQADNTAYPTGDYTPHTSAQLHTFKRSTVVLLSTALAVIVILAVVAAAVGGSIAEERKNKCVAWRNF